jgi:hypothetical protein
LIKSKEKEASDNNAEEYMVNGILLRMEQELLK